MTNDPIIDARGRGFLIVNSGYQNTFTMVGILNDGNFQLEKYWRAECESNNSASIIVRLYGEQSSIAVYASNPIRSSVMKMLKSLFYRVAQGEYCECTAHHCFVMAGHNDIMSLAARASMIMRNVPNASAQVVRDHRQLSQPRDHEDGYGSR